MRQMEESERTEKYLPEAHIAAVQRLLESGEVVKDFSPPLVAGVDLGTSNIQMIVLDASYRPVAARFQWDDSVRDGIVVDYAGARQVVVQFKEKLEEELNAESGLDYAAVGYPPETEPWVESNVVKDSGFDVVGEISEPSAAACALRLDEGIIVDVGGGTTGISVIKSGEIVHTADQATGGHHLSLVISGNKKISYEEAENYKRSRQCVEYSAVVRPVVEKMASIVQEEIARYPEFDTIYLVGGTVIPEGMEDIFSDVLERKVLKPASPILVTPLGIACYGVSRLNGRR